MQQLKTIPAIISNAPFQLYSSTKNGATNPKSTVPRPEPHTAIPVARERRTSNHWVTLTMAGR